MLRSELCDYSDAYFAVEERSVSGNNAANRRSKKLSFENNASFRSCTSKVNNTFIGNAEDLVMRLLYQCIICENIVAIIL